MHKVVLTVVCERPRRKRIGPHKLEQVRKQCAAPVDEEATIAIFSVAKAPCEERGKVLAR